MGSSSTAALLNLWMPFLPDEILPEIRQQRRHLYGKSNHIFSMFSHTHFRKFGFIKERKQLFPFLMTNYVSGHMCIYIYIIFFLELLSPAKLKNTMYYYDRELKEKQKKKFLQTNPKNLQKQVFTHFQKPQERQRLTKRQKKKKKRGKNYLEKQKKQRKNERAKKKFFELP